MNFIRKTLRTFEYIFSIEKYFFVRPEVGRISYFDTSVVYIRHMSHKYSMHIISIVMVFVEFLWFVCE